MWDEDNEEDAGFEGQITAELFKRDKQWVLGLKATDEMLPEWMNLSKLERSIQRSIDRMGAVPRGVAMTRIGQLLQAGLDQQRLAKVS